MVSFHTDVRNKGGHEGKSHEGGASLVIFNDYWDTPFIHGSSFRRAAVLRLRIGEVRQCLPYSKSSKAY